MTALDRTYKLTVMKQPATGGYFDEERHNAIIVSKLRLTAKIERTLDKSPSSAEIKIYNLWEDTRAAFEDRPLRVHLEAGYAGENRLLFVGDVRPGSGSEKDGTEWVTTLRLRDGGRAFSEGRVRRSYQPGTTLATIVRECARGLSLELPAELATSAELAVAVPAGEVLHGWACDELTRLLAPLGYSWSIQSGRLQVLRDDQTVPGTERLIDQAHGMIGVPKLKVPQPTKAKHSKKVKRTTVEYDHLLDGTQFPGLQIRLRGLNLDGSFKLRKVTHELDTHGDPWTTSCEGIPV